MAIGVMFGGMIAGLAAAIASLLMGAPFLIVLLAYCLGGTLCAGLLILFVAMRGTEPADVCNTLEPEPTRG